MKDMLRDIFLETFGEESDGNTRMFFAPGRVNLIGEHTDYNGGYVFPFALPFGTYGVIRKRRDMKVCLHSTMFEENGVISLDLEDLAHDDTLKWVRYPIGVISVFEQHGFHPDSGMEILFYGDIPMGCGLSSSASMEVLTALMLKEVYNFPVSMTDIAQFAREAEEWYCGVKCGIMDQFVSAMGKKGCGIFLDTNSLRFQHVPLHFKDAALIIANTNVQHDLAESEYNIRRAECEMALSDLQKTVDVKNLCSMTLADLKENEAKICGQTNRRRVHHVVSENSRAVYAAKAMKEQDLKTFGKRLIESHISLRDDFEVSCKELDALFDMAMQLPGVYGARMMGGGFGGCTINVVKNESVESFKRTLKHGYERMFGKNVDFYKVSPGPGAHEI